ncbi:MAG: DsrE family protein [Myxococcales bacterium]|nr:DsrE family protein [Myxococcales bacterium]MDD9971869.1 DsrE family protein [Myxococcales bacterium]
MTTYLLIGSQDPFEHSGVQKLYSLAADLAAAGNEVTLMLVENGVLAARRSTVSEALQDLSAKGVSVLADSFALRERGIEQARLQSGVQPAPIDHVIEHLEAGAVAFWN